MLYCHVEVAADDTPAVDAVLKADTKRMALLEEVCSPQLLIVPLKYSVIVYNSVVTLCTIS